MIKIRKWVRDLTTYAPGKPIQYVAREIGINENDIVKLASNENSLGPSPLATAAIQANINEVFRYPDGLCYDLKEKIAEKYSISSDRIIFGNGSDEIIGLLYAAICEEGDETIMAFPSFAEYLLIGNTHKVKVNMASLKNFKTDLNAVRKSVNDRTRIIFLNSPNNPTGAIIMRDELTEFMNKIPNDILVVVDEAYYEFAIGKPGFYETIDMLSDYDNLAILRTFSKAYGLAGLRIGYAIGSKEVIQAINNVRQPFNVNIVAQIAAMAALDDRKFLKQTRKMVKDGMDYLKSEFDMLNLKYVESYANFILVDLKKPDIAEMLLKKGVIVRDMKGYGLENFIRVTVGNSDENKKFITNLRELMEHR